jgi:hypothetical protein
MRYNVGGSVDGCKVDGADSAGQTFSAFAGFWGSIHERLKIINLTKTLTGETLPVLYSLYLRVPRFFVVFRPWTRYICELCSGFCEGP